MLHHLLVELELITWPQAIGGELVMLWSVELQALATDFSPLDSLAQGVDAGTRLLVIHLNLQALALVHNWLHVSLDVHGHESACYESMEASHRVVGLLVLLL